VDELGVEEGEAVEDALGETLWEGDTDRVID